MINKYTKIVADFKYLGTTGTNEFKLTKALGEKLGELFLSFSVQSFYQSVI
jgi:hypothetical protein